MAYSLPLPFSLTSGAPETHKRWPPAANKRNAMNSGMFTQIAQITEHLYLSGAAAVHEDRLKRLGITCVINCTLELPTLSPGIETVHIRVGDAPHAPLSAYFDRVVKKITKVRNKGGKTLIHCMAGVSRSASLCIVYLMKEKRMSLKKAHEHVKSRRPFIRPNVGFWQQLIEYEKRLYSKSSVSMVQSGIGVIPDVYSSETKNMAWATTYQSDFGS